LLERSSIFSEYEQHDAQEFLIWMLDNLHEDVNKVKSKPYVEYPDFDGSIPDSQGATTYWQGHKSRNDSIIVDLFYGQYKSNITCTKCSKVLMKYDPFMNISAEVPESYTLVHSLVMLPTGKRLRYYIPVLRTAKFGDVLEKLALFLNVHVDQIRTVAFANHGPVLLDGDRPASLIAEHASKIL
jgi:ubiquitin carboxyl-terminal hydrolase 4/11/15